jgi:hypothetical protein
MRGVYVLFRFTLKMFITFRQSLRGLGLLISTLSALVVLAIVHTKYWTSTVDEEDLVYRVVYDVFRNACECQRLAMFPACGRTSVLDPSAWILLASSKWLALVAVLAEAGLLWFAIAQSSVRNSGPWRLNHDYERWCRPMQLIALILIVGSVALVGLEFGHGGCDSSSQTNAAANAQEHATPFAAFRPGRSLTLLGGAAVAVVIGLSVSRRRIGLQLSLAMFGLVALVIALALDEVLIRGREVRPAGVTVSWMSAERIGFEWGCTCPLLMPQSQLGASIVWPLLTVVGVVIACITPEVLRYLGAYLAVARWTQFGLIAAGGLFTSWAMLQPRNAPSREDFGEGQYGVIVGCVLFVCLVLLHWR